MREMVGAGSDKHEPNVLGGNPAMLDITHRRNRLAGMWAAELLGLIGFAAHDYARSVVHSDHADEHIHGDDHEQVIGKLSTDLAGRVTMTEIRDKMTHFLSEARRQIRSEKKD